MKHIKGIQWHTFESAEEAANAAYLALVMDCVDYGQDPNYEVQIYSPEQSQKRGYTSGWHLVWECGPTSWGLHESMGIVSGGIVPPWGFCETHWGFDLIFVEETL